MSEQPSIKSPEFPHWLRKMWVKHEREQRKIHRAFIKALQNGDGRTVKIIDRF